MHLSGFYLGLAEGLDPVANTRLLNLTQDLLSDLLPGVTDLVPGYVNLYVEFDANKVALPGVRRWAEQHLQSASKQARGKKVEVPVRYDGIDLSWVAAQTGLSEPEVIRLHSQPQYRVFATGFTPGFPFLGSLDERLRLPRRTIPRTSVPAHSVAIAGTQSGIYPLTSPGGWHLIGTALEQMYNPRREPTFWLEAGDTVRFAPSSGETPPVPDALELLPLEPRYPVLRLEQPGLLDLLMDSGRKLGGRFGLAASGALDWRSARIANALVGNPPDAPLLELNLIGPTFTALADIGAAVVGYVLQPVVNGEPLAIAESFVLRKGDTLSFKPGGKLGGMGVRSYLALAGGIESGLFFGSASTDLRGLIGRPLRAGDVLGVAKPRMIRPGRSFSQPDLSTGDLRIRLLPGPQYNPEALRALTSSHFTLSTGDRMGVRLVGTQVPGGELISEATPLGAVQITTQGQPIVLLNDRGRIGGYAKPALVHPADLPWLAQLGQGRRVRFVYSN